MKRLLPFFFIALLAACKEEVADRPVPVSMTASAVGHFCQMNLLEHPGPKAQVHLVGLPGAPLFFSQVRDGIAFLRMPEQSHEIDVIYVSDMGRAPSWDAPGPENWVAAGKAHFVIGSNRTGGMGAPEVVPFAELSAARAFAGQHGGRVAALSEIDEIEVLAPVDAVDDATTGKDDFKSRLRALSQ